MGTVTRGLSASYMHGGRTFSTDVMFSYKNTSSSKENIISVVMPFASGYGTFTAGDRVTGDGTSFNYYLTANSINSSTVNVTRVVTPTSGGYPNVGSMTYYTFSFSGLTLSAGSTLKFKFQPCQQNLGTNLCVCFGNKAEHVTVNVGPATYTVTFNLNGGTRTGGGALTQTVESGGSATAPTCTRDGYTFAGWDKSFSNVTSDLTVTAQWTANTYTITYNANGGSGAPSSGTKTFGRTYTISSTQPTGRSYTVTFNPNGGTCSETSRTVTQTFKNWNTAADGSGTKSYAPGSSYTINADLTLYAQYTDPTIGTLPEAENGDSDFYGWYDAKTGGTKVSSSTTVSGNMTVYARWECLAWYYYNTTGGDEGEDLGLFLSESISEKRNESGTYYITDLIPNISTKSFVGWNTAANGSGTTYTSGKAYTGDDSLTLYAQWDSGKYTVIFDANGGYFYRGTSQQTSKITYTNVTGGTQAGPPDENPTRSGHTFLGWIGNYTNVLMDTTILAMWNRQPIWIENSNHEWEGYG